MSKSGMMAAVAAAAGMSADAENDGIVVDAAFVAKNFPDVAAALRAEGHTSGLTAGATAERERILGIEKAALPGHEAIIAAHKADGSKTPSDAALAVIAAENATRSTMLDGLKADDGKVKIRSEPANGAAAPASAPQDAKAGKTGEDLWKAEFAESADLKTEFGSEKSYLAFKRAEASGQAKIFTPKPAA